MLRFVDIKTRTLELLDEAATSAVTNTTENLVESTINAAHRRLCLARSWAFMKWPREESFTTTANIRHIALNPNVGKLLYVWDTVTRSYLPLIPLREWEAQSVDRSAVTDFRGAVFGGHWPVQTQPTVATAVSIESDNIADDTGPTVIIRGIDSAGDVVEETLAADGVVAVPSTTLFVAILNVTKVGTWVGTLTVALGSTTILTLRAGEYGKQYPTLEFCETIQTAGQFLYSFIRNPRTLSNDNDIPEIPYPFSEVLVYDALLEIATYRTDINVTHVKLWMDRRDSIIKQLSEAQDEVIAGAHPRLVRDLEGARGRSVIFGTS